MAQGETSSGDAQRPRVARRYKVFEATRMSGADGERRIHLINVSETGALIHGSAPPPPSVVRISIAGEDVAARVVWIDGDRFGIVFARRLDQRLLDKLMRT